MNLLLAPDQPGFPLDFGQVALKSVDAGLLAPGLGHDGAQGLLHVAQLLLHLADVGLG